MSNNDATLDQSTSDSIHSLDSNDFIKPENSTRQQPRPYANEALNQELNPDTEPELYANVLAYGVPENGDELTRDEASVQMSKVISRRMIGTDDILRKEQLENDEILPRVNEDSTELPPMLPNRDPYTVGYLGVNDPIHPHNYSLPRKLKSTFAYAMSALSIAMGSALFSAAQTELMKIYHINVSVAALNTSLFVLGFAAGPVIYAPLSELYGRKTFMCLAMFLYAVFSFAVATAENLQTIIICRFFAGFCGSAPVVLAAAGLSDLFNTRQRGYAITIFSIKNSALGWRWTSYFCGILGAFAFVLDIFLLDETHHPIILVKKAEMLRRKTGNWGIYAPHEELSLNLKEIVENNITRPLKLMVTESIILLVSIYNAFIYAMLYMFLTALPMIFGTRRGWSEGVQQLPYIAMLLGIFIGSFIIIFFEKRYLRAMDANGGKPQPEVRLSPVMVGGFIFVIGIFLMAWSGDYPAVHWIVPCIGACFVGCGLISIFLPTMNYIIDSYLYIAASALAANTFIRSGLAAVMPLFSYQMFHNLTIKWAGTLVALLATLLLPMPFFFYKYGKGLRQRSKYSYKG
ncbi:unnamed protein product [Candida verbasci]|uniref:Major facilitator superfamily (MFS) profile domain-containing protein n=1 Tax=Candida verbasci TaxID=1227364 RepID=A0A9W4TTE5_9ASCO|nr:unnamed protein product [Candida verbasci]